MGYVDEVLQPGEQLLHRAYLHWLLYAPAFATAVVGVVLLVLGATYGGGIALVPGAAVGLAAVYFWLGAWIRRSTTELAVTNRRIILKRGWIRRRTVEMNMDKVESVDVEQSVLGRIFNCGNVVVRGTGAGLEPIRAVEDPLTFRSFVTAR
ncbi:MAG: PH domain-containing protein [Acidobacteriota bacterium]